MVVRLLFPDLGALALVAAAVGGLGGPGLPSSTDIAVVEAVGRKRLDEAAASVGARGGGRAQRRR